MSKDDHFPVNRGSDASPVAGQLSLAIQTGLPLESGLRALAEQTRSWRTKESLLELCRRLEQGLPLVEAMRDTTAGLPKSMQALVKAGMETGQLDAVMQYSIEQSQRAISLRQQIWLSLSYPIFLVWFSALICGAILLFIIPVFSDIFNDFGTELPGLTLALVNFASIMKIFGDWSLTVFLLGGLGLCLIILFAGISRWGNRWATSIPLIGRVFRFAALTDFCQIMAILIESGLAFPKSLQFAGYASDDRWLNRRCQLMSHAIEDGATPEIAARQVKLPNTLAQVFRNANSERSLADALRGLSDIYAAQCFVASKLVTTVTGPFTVSTVLLFVGTTVLALFMPLIKLLNDLS